jgi:hypothetical protein
MRKRTKVQKNPPGELKGAFFNEDGSIRQRGQTPTAKPVQPEARQPQSKSAGYPGYKNAGLLARGAKS